MSFNSVKELLRSRGLEGKPLKLIRDQVVEESKAYLKPNQQINADFQLVIAQALENVIINCVVDLVEAFYCRIIHVPLPYGLLNRLNTECLLASSSGMKKELFNHQISQIFGYQLTDRQLYNFVTSINKERAEREI